MQLMFAWLITKLLHLENKKEDSLSPLFCFRVILVQRINCDPIPVSHNSLGKLRELGNVLFTVPWQNEFI